MKKLNAEKMEMIEGGDCFGSIMGAIDNGWACHNAGSSGYTCLIAGIYLFDLMQNCI